MTNKQNLVVLLDFPTYQEIKEGVPLGRLPRSLIEKSWAALGGGNINYVSVIQDLGVLGKNPLPKVWEKERNRVLATLKSLNPTKILAAGPIATTLLLGNTVKKNVNIMHTRGLGFESDILGTQVFTVSTFNPYTPLRDSDLFRDFAYDIQKLFTASHPVSLPKVNVNIAETKEQVFQGLEFLLHQDSPISCDLETTGFNPKQNRIESIGFGWVDSASNSNQNLIIPRELVYSEEVKRAILVFSIEVPLLVFHNAKFDLKFLKVLLGPDFSPKVQDTMLMAYAADERPIGRYLGKSLKDLARTRYDAPDYAISFEEFYAEEDETKRDYIGLYSYQAYDTYFTACLYQTLGEELEEEDPKLLDLVNNLLVPATKTFVDVELKGIKIDQGYLKEHIDRLTKKCEDGVEELKTLLGKPTFNPYSPKQVQELLFTEWGLTDKDKNGGGGHQSHSKKQDFSAQGSSAGDDDQTTSRDALLQYAKHLPAQKKYIVEKIADLRIDRKIVSTYLQGLLNLVWADGRIHTDLRLVGTSTGRIASAEPNLQNIPNLYGPLVRNAFIPDEGNVFVQFDYSQLELRVTAHLCGDEKMKEVYQQGIDLHAVVAGEIFNKQPSEVTYLERYLAKRVDFGLLYGRSAQALAEGGEMDLFVEQGGTRFTVKQAQGFIDNFLAGFPKLKSWMLQQNADVKKNHFTTTLTSRRRRFPLILPQMVGGINRQSVNTPIQGLASDICLSSLVRIHPRLPEGAYILFSVHDSILIECRKGQEEEVRQIAEEEMTKHYLFPSDVPFTVDAEKGESWGTLAKWKKLKTEEA